VNLFALWFGLRTPVSRSAYAWTGIGLMAVKYAAEAALLWALKQELLDPVSFANPLITQRLEQFGSVGAGVVFIWTLPFIWIGLSMSLRRAVDAGIPAWIGGLFLLPLVNWLVMLMLAVLPSRPRAAIPAEPAREPAGAGDASVGTDDADDQRSRSLQVVLLSVAAGAGIGAAMVALSVYVLQSYGAALFVATPVLMGMVSGAIAARHGFAWGNAVILGQAALALAMLMLIAVAAEGSACVIMAWIPAAPLTLFGTSLGGLLCGQGRQAGRTLVLLALAALPLLAWHDAASPNPPTLRAVVTTIDIAAPPAAVWARVVSFTDLPPPDGIFAIGIACPLRATITGSGVGAIRRCEFTTGPFIEPITAWEPGRRLAFDVISQPPALRELSIWADVRAPHLDGYLMSRRGEFLLMPLNDGGTRLTGTTWYEVDIHPEGYWALWAGGFIHAIHGRVLAHIRALAEGDVAAARVQRGQ
jgi:uncharacterized membrane protein YhaH (DUF805 family)